MNLSSLQIITLLQIKNCGIKSTFFIANYISENENIDIKTLDDLLNLIKNLKQNKILKRFPDLEINDLQEAENTAKLIIKRSQEENIKIINYYDKEYPEQLRHTVNEKGKEDPPIILYYKGDISITSRPGIAVIGSREPTKEGLIAGEYLSSKFAEKGFNIISGLAIGCDTVGHKGAIKVHGKTTAILANGLDTVYPKQNELLAKKILENGGLLLSENPVGTPINRYNLVARDRLQAALALVTLVIQTGVKGGTMHAANTTLISNKPLYCIWYKDEIVRNNEKVLGNELLVSKGAEYIKSDFNIDDILLISDKKKNN